MLVIIYQIVVIEGFCIFNKSCNAQRWKKDIIFTLIFKCPRPFFCQKSLETASSAAFTPKKRKINKYIYIERERERI